MKTPYTFLLAMVLGWTLQAQTVPVTFSVDMNNETVVDTVGVHVAGNFQGWDPAATAMTDDDMDGIYTVTVDVSDTLGLVEYKFINGDAWGADEAAPEACAWNGGTNRYFELSGETALDTVCFGQCGACGTTTILFQVDMSQEEVNPNGVFMIASFAPSFMEFIAMDDADGDLIYTHVETVIGDSLPEMDTVIFRFSNGDDFAFNEVPEGECANEAAFRVLPLGMGDMVYETSAGQAHCFAQCGSCVAPTPVTFRVDMSTQAAVSDNGVCIAGNFQGWSAGVDFLTDDDGDLVYETTLDISPGDYEFKFINGNNWGGDGDGNIDNENPPGDCTTNGNRTFSVGTDPVTVEYCYNQCSAACVADPDPANITFKVDMSDTVVAETGVWLIGGITSPQWQAGALQMSDADGDNIYEVTYEVSGSAFFEYRFCNGDPYPGGVQDDSVAEVGDFEAGGCGQANPFGEFNRTHVRSGMEEELGPFCYASCLTCSGDTVVIGIEELQDFIGLEAFPNPAEDELNLRFDGFEGLADIRVFDLSGQIILSERTRVVPGMVTTYGTESFRPGMYILEVRNGLRRSTLRLTVK